MRLFLALNLEPAVRAAVHDATAPLRAAAPSLRWVKEPMLHVTIKFLDEQPESAVEPIGAAMARVATRHRAIDVRLGGIGAFPNLRRPRVVWMGIEREPRLELLHHDVEVACETLGYEVEGRPFRPHLTLARVDDRVPHDEIRALARAAKDVRFRTTMLVGAIDLMASGRSPDGPRYEVLAAAPLRGT